MLKQQQLFYRNNRLRLRQLVKSQTGAPDLIVIAGNSFIQASADRAFPFEQDSSFYYLTGINDPEVVLVIDSGEEYLIAPSRNASQVAFEGLVDINSMAKVSGINTVLTAEEGWKQLSSRVKKLKAIATMKPPERYIPHYEMFTNPSREFFVAKLCAEVETVAVHDIRKHLATMRMIKSDYEISMIRRAIKETADLFNAIERVREEAGYEHDLLAEITALSIKKRLAPAYEPIIASGKNALTLHYVKNNSRLEKKGMLLLDIGLKYNGYSADISRTISFAPTKRQTEIYNSVLAVQNYAMGILKPGVIMKEYEARVVKFMGRELHKLKLIKNADKENIRKFYPHSTSHFLGLDVHDVGDYEQPLQPGMVLTVEPGIYIKDESIGIRLEDDVLITSNGCKNLSGALPKSISSLTIRASSHE